MYSYTGGRNQFGVFTNNASAANLTIGDGLISNATRELLRSRVWDFLKKTWTINSVAATQFYTLPSEMYMLSSLITTIGTTNYFPSEVPSYDKWLQLNDTTGYQSNTTENYILFNGQVGLWPIPSSSTSNFITLSGTRRFKDLSIADYITGGVAAATINSPTITGNGTTWNSSMAGRWIQISESGNGDGLWYQILSVQSTTSLTLVGNYNGISFAAANAAYTIGQVSLLPEPYQILPVYKATQIYYTTIQPDMERASEFKNLYDEGLKRMIADWGEKSTSPVIDYGPNQDAVKNPNLYIQI